MLIRELLEPRPKQKHYRSGCLKTATLATVRLVFQSWLNIDVHKAGDINMATFTYIENRVFTCVVHSPNTRCTNICLCS